MIAFLWFLKIIIGERVKRRKKLKQNQSKFWLLSKTNFEVLRLGGRGGSRRGGWAIVDLLSPH